MADLHTESSKTLLFMCYITLFVYNIILYIIYYITYPFRPSEDFNYGIVMSDRPLNDNELFEVEIKQLVDRWSGSLEIGVSTQNPEGYDFPSSSMNMRSGTWIMSGNAVQCDGHILCCSYDANLDYLKVSSTCIR